MVLPGCVSSRALRSRLLQQQLTRSITRQAAPWTTSTTRRFSLTSAQSRNEFSPRRDHEFRKSKPKFKSAPWSNRPGKTSVSSTPSQKIFDRGFGHIGDDDLLMEIAQEKTQAVNRKRVRLEMEWVKDPLLLATRVSSALRAGNPEMAARLAREAVKESPGDKYTVAWNRIFQYCMDRGHPKPALRFFNDMKKRAGKPNTRTFTILLTGLRKAPKIPGFNIVKTAEHIYNSISATNSEVKLDIIHTNAMLSVCQYHGDVDSLWRIAGELSEQGSGAPNMRTYTVILGALQYAARDDVKRMDAYDINGIFARKNQLMIDAKRIWADIIHRFKDGDVLPDNRVVNSMAELLLEGATEQNYYDVFSLYNQTMGIPILCPRLSANAKNRPSIVWEVKQRREGYQAPEEENVPFVDENNQTLKLGKDGNRQEELIRGPREETSDVEGEEEVEENFDELFEPLADGPVPELRPNNKDLTLIIDACLSMSQGLGPGAKYWKHLTLESTPYKIQPDSAATMHLLRLLRLSRASKMSVQVIRDQLLPLGEVDGKAFHIALSACRRDNHNHACLVNGNEIMNMMGKALILPDPRALESYVDLVRRLERLPNILMYLKGLDIDEKREARNMQSLGKKLYVKLHLLAIETLRPHIAKLHEAVENGKPAPLTRWNSVAGGKEKVHSPVQGLMLVKTMPHIRLMIDELLKSEYSSFISKAERQALQSDSKLLKPYSDQATIEKLSGEVVFPTQEQRTAHREANGGFQFPELEENAGGEEVETSPSDSKSES
ncbi:hypothetical protein N7478_008275 [Penicillium angulare]|uniref:uncharacterized protein n=1 Tax=Penicillium angulare TaxID=116970 RepID=UPI00253F740B|nr:uncharacterized protein N7478_008275 [Penicillium angulare]KAJ5273150.1 hypothetical protein N7478_008275 [Penicillium angulare]